MVEVIVYQCLLLFCLSAFRNLTFNSFSINRIFFYQQGIGEVFVGLGLVVGPAVGGLLYGVCIIFFIEDGMCLVLYLGTMLHIIIVPHSI